LVMEGCKVVISDIDFQTAQKVAESLKERGGDTLAIAADVSKKSKVEPLVNRTVQKYGGIDILVNNAGMARSLS
jgi:NAD(P)-dependent dehydrogenase (short-subunit alcohol dehydrogenase family)